MRQFVYRFEAMTTPCEIQVFAKAKAEADTVAHLALQETKRLEKKYSYYHPDSYLSRINRREISEIDKETENLIRRSVGYYAKTKGLFDITVGTIKDAYRHSLAYNDMLQEKSRLLHYTGCEHLSVRKGKLHFDNPYTRLDMGGLVKEYAVDRVCAILKKKKVYAGLVNYGGDICAFGRKPNGSKFRIGIKDPDHKGSIVKYIEIENEAMTTSASYERSYKIEEKAFSHILSKETVDNKVKSVTVLSPSCVESGVYSTALMIDPTIKTEHRTILI